MGMIYKRGKVFWIKYYSGGRPIRESTGATKQKDAEWVLKNREGRSAAGLPPLPRVDRTSPMTNWRAICVCIMRPRARVA